MDEQAGREERYEAARREAAEAHEAAGDAEDGLVDAERLRDAAASAEQHDEAQGRVDQVEEQWRLRLNAADLATERRDRARDAVEGAGDDPAP